MTSDEKLRLNERVFKMLEKTTYRVASCYSDLRAIGNLRYHCYHRGQAISPNENCELVDEHDEYENCYIFGVYFENQLVSSIRIHVVRSFNESSPAIEIFPECLKILQENGLIIVDPNRFVVDRAASQKFPEPHFVTLRIPFMAAEYFKAGVTTATVRKEHAPSYRRVLRCNELAKPRQYLSMTKPLGLLVAQFQTERMRVLENFPFMTSREFEAQSLFGADEATSS